MRVSTALTLRQAIWEKVRPRIVAKLKKVEDANAWFSSEPGVAVHKTGTIRLRRVTVATRFESHKTTRHYLDELEEIAKLESLERTYGGASGGARRERTAAQAPEPEPAVPSRGGGIGRSGRPSGAAAVQSADYVREQYRQGKRAIEEEKRQLHERREREQLMQERENLEQYKSEAALKVRREATDVSRGESNSDATTHSSASSCSESGDEGEGRQRPTHLRRSLEEESGSESEDGSGSESEDEDDMLARAAASMDDTGGRDPLRSPQSDKTESEEYVGDGEDDLSDDFDDDDE